MWVPLKFDFPFWWLIKLLLKEQLHDFEWGPDQLFLEGERLRQIICLWDTANKTQCSVITKLKWPIIIFVIWALSLFSYMYLILIHHWQLREEICHYSIKSMFTIIFNTWAEYYLQKNTFTSFNKCILQPIFLGSYLQVTWWALGKWKGRQSTVNDNWNSVTKLATHVSCGIEV